MTSRVIYTSELLSPFEFDQEKNYNIPFPSLPSLLVTATFMSYVGYDFEVKDLLLRLSKRTQGYLKQQQLKGFMVTPPNCLRQQRWVINFTKDQYEDQVY